MAIDAIDGGLDTYSLIQEIMQAERAPINRMELNQKIINKRKEIYNDVLSRIKNLENYVSKLSTASSFEVFKASYSQQSVANFSTGLSVSAASYDITVEDIAAAHTIGSDRVEDAAAALGLNEGSIRINGVDIFIDGDDSLLSIKDKINNQANIGVSATIVDNVLRLKSLKTGAEEIQVEDNQEICFQMGILDGDQNFKNEFIAAADASFYLDGQHITSSSNSLSGIIEGVTIDLVGEGSTRATIERDIDSLIKTITNFVNQYNSALTFIYSQVSERKIVPPTSDADKLVGTLSADGTLNRIRFMLNGLASSSVQGAAAGFDSLANIGISRISFNSKDSDNSGIIIGALQIDEPKLREALGSNPEDIKELFTKNNGVEGLDETEYGIAVRMGNYLKTVNGSDGIISTKKSSFESELKSIDRRIEALERRLELKEKSITKQFVAMEVALDNMDYQMTWLRMQIEQLG